MKTLLQPSWRWAFGLVTIACGAAPEAAPEQPATEAAKQPAAVVHAATLDPKAIAFGLSRHPEVRDCFSASTGDGYVTLSWTVDASGKVTGTEVERATLDDERVHRCLSGKVEALRFTQVQRRSEGRWTFIKHLEGLPVADSSERQERALSNKKRKKRRVGHIEGLRVEKHSPGFLEPSEIENRVDGALQLYAHCFREGVLRDGALQGIVRLRFIIEEDGSVREVRDGGSDLPDPAAISCIAEGFYAMSFPKPRRGAVHVLYPIRFNL